MHCMRCGECLWIQGSGCIEDETVSHEGDQHNTWVMRSLGDCLVFPRATPRISTTYADGSDHT